MVIPNSNQQNGVPFKEIILPFISKIVLECILSSNLTVQSRSILTYVGNKIHNLDLKLNLNPRIWYPNQCFDQNSRVPDGTYIWIIWINNMIRVDSRTSNALTSNDRIEHFETSIRNQETNLYQNNALVSKHFFGRNWISHLFHGYYGLYGTTILLRLRSFRPLRIWRN